jgi:hypothetical protein
MTQLNHEARETLRWAGITPGQWAKRHGYESAKDWRGDECGCTDDRCIGYHHDATDECGCLPALIEELRRDERKLAAARPVWAAHERATESGTAEDRAAADQLAAEWIAEYNPGATWHALTARGIVYRNQWNDRTWLIYDADRDSIETADVTDETEISA